MSKTIVVNLRLGPHFDVYCGRVLSCPEDFTGDGSDGYFGNNAGVPYSQRGDRMGAIKAYREWFDYQIERDATFKARVLSLRGKVLACWCVPLPCHVSEVIIPWLERNGA